jgi:aspartate/methionine/tyrosine aminotransferase
MAKEFLINDSLVKNAMNDLHLESVGNATIREIVRLVNRVEEQTGIKFIRMEMGVPGIDASEIALEAEIKAFKAGMASKYAPIEGAKPLKEEISRFVKLFLDIDIKP